MWENTRKFKIFPSILSANLAMLAEEVYSVIEAGADGIHFDVMDNHYVPNLTFGAGICQALRGEGIESFIDVHLMTTPVDSLIEQFAKAGANAITIHPDATPDLGKSLSLITALGMQAGLAFNPQAPLTPLQPYLEKIDTVLIMSVNPGWGGQAFMADVLPKIEQARMLIDHCASSTRLAVDGGVSVDNIRDIAQAGADTFIAGSAIFGTDNYGQTLQALRLQLD